MANCTECLKINPIPSCLNAESTFEIDNITFPNNPAAELTAVITDTATKGVRYVFFTEGDNIDLSDLFPFMEHYYEIKFYTATGVPVDFTITNPDATTADGCCLEFIPSEGLEWTGYTYSVSTTNCVVV